MDNARTPSPLDRLLKLLVGHAKWLATSEELPESPTDPVSRANLRSLFRWLTAPDALPVRTTASPQKKHRLVWLFGRQSIPIARRSEQSEARSVLAWLFEKEPIPEPSGELVTKEDRRHEP